MISEDGFEKEFSTTNDSQMTENHATSWVQFVRPPEIGFCHLEFLLFVVDKAQTGPGCDDSL